MSSSYSSSEQVMKYVLCTLYECVTLYSGILFLSNVAGLALYNFCLETNPVVTCDVWPFAKLLNGFSSHMYVYSPTLLDSQELLSQTCEKN